MNDQTLLDERIKNIERELLNLKTTHFKTATTISTMTQNNTLDFSLMLDSLSTNVFSSQRAIITMTTVDGTDMLSACYLVGMNPTNLDSRTIQVQRLQSGAGVVRFGIAVFSQNPNDFNTLSQGGTVQLSYTIQSVGTSQFTTSISYVSITGGTA